ncbi:MAG: sigma-70 family RNA polymerase sigma factor [Actinomycetota bacterium]
MHEVAARRQEPELHRRFRSVYEDTVDDVFGFLRLRVGGNRQLAEDLTAETYAAAVRLFNEGRDAEVTLSWLRTVARRRLIDHWRRVSVADSKVAVLADRVPVRPETEVVEQRELVIASLGRLSDAQRRVLVLRHVDGYPVARIAELLGRSEKGVESLLVRARAAFREAYEEVSRD